jgi:hypothetical protein
MSKVEPRTVTSTSDYNLFTRLPGNRDIDPIHVNNLVKAMEKEYVFDPISVNESFQVLDGQHRLEAHKRLGIPVPYYWDTVGDLETVQKLNNSQKNWTNEDYTKSFIERGFKDYEIYKSFKEAYGLPHVICIILLSGEHRGRNKMFKTGNFTVRNLKLAQQKATILTQLEPYFSHWKEASFLRAMNKALIKEGFDVQTFIHRAAANSTMFVPCTSVDQYLLLIENVYNFGAATKTGIRFAADDVNSPWKD